MPISYLVSMEQLSVLAHFKGITSFRGLPELPAVSGDKSESIVVQLEEQGMLHKYRNEVSPDLAVSFILDTIAKPELILRFEDGENGYCSKSLGVAVRKDRYAPWRYCVAPCPSPNELAGRLWEQREGEQEVSVWRGGGWENAALTRESARKIIASVYTEVSE